MHNRSEFNVIPVKLEYQLLPERLRVQRPSILHTENGQICNI